MKWIKISLITVNLLCFIYSGSAIAVTNSQNTSSTKEMRTIKGSVVDVDPAGSQITIKTIDDEITFYVPGDASLTSGSRSIALVDVSYGDQVRIDYYSIQNSNSGLMVSHLVDLNSEKDY